MNVAALVGPLIAWDERVNRHWIWLYRHSTYSNRHGMSRHGMSQDDPNALGFSWNQGVSEGWQSR